MFLEYCFKVSNIAAYCIKFSNIIDFQFLPYVKNFSYHKYSWNKSLLVYLYWYQRILGIETKLGKWFLYTFNFPRTLSSHIRLTVNVQSSVYLDVEKGHLERQSEDYCVYVIHNLRDENFGSLTCRFSLYLTVACAYNFYTIICNHNIKEIN